MGLIKCQECWSVTTKDPGADSLDDMMNNQYLATRHAGCGECRWPQKQAALGSASCVFPGLPPRWGVFLEEVLQPKQDIVPGSALDGDEAIRAANYHVLCTLSCVQTWGVSAVDLNSHFSRWQ